MKHSFGFKRHLTGALAAVSVMFTGLLSTGCHIIDDYEGDCSVKYNVEIRFTKNLWEVDAFSSKVSSVTLLVYDKSGNLVTSKTESGSALQREHYTMQIDVQPGTYDLVAWGGLENNNTFSLNGGASPSQIGQAGVTMTRERDADGAVSKKQLQPLFHAINTGVEFPGAPAYGDVTVATMDMMKNTNTIRIILTHYNGEAINPDDFTFRITDNNGKMHYDNTVLDDETITYREWTKRDLPTVEDYEPSLAPAARANGEINSINTMIAEIDLARILTSHNPRLTVNCTDREDPVLSLPITQLLLHAKGEARSPMSDQEYLDRQDEYNIMFFLQTDNSWYTNPGIYINGWHMRYQESEL